MKKDNNSNDRETSAISQVEAKVDNLIITVKDVLDSVSSSKNIADNNSKDISELVKTVTIISDAVKSREEAAIKRENNHNSKLDLLQQAMQEERAKNAQLEEKIKSQNDNISKLTDAVSILVQNAQQNQDAVAAVSKDVSSLFEVTKANQNSMAESISQLGDGLNFISAQQFAIEDKFDALTDQSSQTVDVLDRMAVRVDNAAARLEKIDGALASGIESMNSSLESGFISQKNLAIKIAERQHNSIVVPLQKLNKIAPAMEEQAENIRNAIIMFQNTNTSINKANLRNYKELEVIANGLNNKVENALEFGIASITPTIESKVAGLLEPMLSGVLVHVEKVKVAIEKLEEDAKNVDFSSIDGLEENINGVRVVCEDTIAALSEQQTVAIEFSKTHMAQNQEVVIENEKLVSKFNALNKGAEHNLRIVSEVQSEYVNIVSISETLSRSINQLLAESNSDSKEYLIKALSALRDELKVHIDASLDESSSKGLLKVLGHTPDDQQ